MATNPQKIPWYVLPPEEIDPAAPLESEWEYVIFDPSHPQKVIRTGERPPDEEILASPLLKNIR